MFTTTMFMYLILGASVAIVFALSFTPLAGFMSMTLGGISVNLVSRFI